MEADASGTYKEVGSGMVAESMARRYIMNASVTDFTGERLVNVFNDQAATMLKASADELHSKKVLTPLFSHPLIAAGSGLV